MGAAYGGLLQLEQFENEQKSKEVTEKKEGKVKKIKDQTVVMSELGDWQMMRNHDKNSVLVQARVCSSAVASKTQNSLTVFFLFRRRWNRKVIKLIDYYSAMGKPVKFSKQLIARLTEEVVSFCRTTTNSSN